MNRAVVLGAAAAGAVIAMGISSRRPGRRLGSILGHRMLRQMENILKSLPDSSPPKLVVSILPLLRDQNNQIIALLQEQNALLRTHLASEESVSPK